MRRRAVATLAALALAPFAVNHWREPPPELRATRFSLDLPANTSVTLSGSVVPWLEVSPDGRHIAFIAASPEGTRLWVRSLNEVNARALTGRENVLFWSPDSRSVAFAADGFLKVVDVGGGARTIAKLPQAIGSAAPLGRTWSGDGTILLGSNANAIADSRFGERQQAAPRSRVSRRGKPGRFTAIPCSCRPDGGSLFRRSAIANGTLPGEY